MTERRSNVAAVALVSALLAGSLLAEATEHPQLAMLLWLWALSFAAIRLIRWLGRR